MSTFKLPHIRKRSCRPYPESGAGTVEYVIVVLVAIVICEWSLLVAIPIWTNASSFSSDASPLMMK